MFRSKKERYAYVQGIKKGNKGGKPWGKLNKRRRKKRSSLSGKRSSGNNPFGMTYAQMLKEDELRKRELFGDDFDRDSRGRIKGSYIDGRFEPDQEK